MTKPVAIILGAGQPARGTSASDRRLVDRNRNVFEWQLEALARVTSEVQFIGGFDLEHAVGERPGIQFHSNPFWQTTGSAYSLFQGAIDPDAPHLICYSDILFRAQLVAELSTEHDAIVIAIDRQRVVPRRANREVVHLAKDGTPLGFGSIAGMPSEVADFIGLMWVPAQWMPALLKLRDAVVGELRRTHLAALAQLLLERGVPLRLIDADGRWTDLDDDYAIARFLFGTKAETLARLALRISQSYLLPQLSFTVARWRADSAGILREIRTKFNDKKLAIRSSTVREDSFAESAAGKFETVLGVAAAETRKAIEHVVGSYDDDDENQVLVQPFIADAKASGVILTRTLGEGSPYYVVNYTLGPSTNSVTAGTTITNHAYIHRAHTSLAPKEPSFLTKLVKAAAEIESLTDLDALDIEFVISADDTINVLQIRPLVFSRTRTREDDRRLNDALENAARSWRDWQTPPVPILAERPLYGVMSDWNPAEIIGVVPSPLAISLYRALVTDEIWARQRFEFGYRDLRGTPLMRTFAGHPYVDVRASITSFIPVSLPESLARRISRQALIVLSSDPTKHDRVEFEVVPTCFDLDFSRWNERIFAPAGIDRYECDTVSDAYRAITSVVDQWCRASYEAAAAYLERTGGSLAKECNPERLRRLTQDCGVGGALPFAHLARCGFIAVSQLRTAVAAEVITAERADAFLRSVRTVSHDLLADANSVRKGHRKFEWLVARYGHLRPGTYDICSPRYADNPEFFLGQLVDSAQPDDALGDFEWTSEELRNWQAAINARHFPIDIEHLTDFMRRAIEGREFGKFSFSKGISAVLEEIAGIGEAHGFSREELATFQLQDILTFATDSGVSIAQVLRHRLDEGQRAWQTATEIQFPPLLTEEDQLLAFESPVATPNFITSGRVNARTLLLSAQPLTKDSLAEKIVLIASADPGYDWIFGHRIKGLITAYGGANSHMAIRCAEFGLPAAIGVGDSAFRTYRAAKLIDLDCRTRQIMVIK